jgi:hypothetical protein
MGNKGAGFEAFDDIFHIRHHLGKIIALQSLKLSYNTLTYILNLVNLVFLHGFELILNALEYRRAFYLTLGQ